MKQRLIQLGARIDALTVRERALLFAAAVAVIAFAGHQFLLAPAYQAQAKLLERILQQRNDAMRIDAEVIAKVHAYQVDPDASTRERLAAVRQETVQLGESLMAMQHGLVAPERMAPLLEAILRANGRLQLVSMRTLPVEPLTGGEAGSAGTGAATPGQAPGAPVPAPADAARPAGLLYRHGVEVTVRGNYLDMVDYMSALEAMPTRLFWGRAQLDVEQHPASRLTLTLYTLSLDRNWMKL